MSSPRQARSVEPFGRVLHLDAALVAIDAQAQLVEMAGRPAAGMDDAERAVGELDASW